jgi:hypothetical protein
VPQELGRALGERVDQTLALKLISHAEDGGVLATGSRCRRGPQRSASFTTSAQPASAAQPISAEGHVSMILTAQRLASTASPSACTRLTVAEGELP